MNTSCKPDGLETRPRTTFVNNKTSLVTGEGDENARILSAC